MALPRTNANDDGTADVPAPAVSPPRPAIEYEQTSSQLPVTRRQFRWLLILIALHLAVTVQTTYVPGVTASLKQWWAARQQLAAQAAAAKQAAALERAVLNFAHPPKTVVWEEDPPEAAKLMAGAGYRWVRVSPLDRAGSEMATMLANWPKAAVALPPAPLNGVPIQTAGSVDWVHSQDYDGSAVAFMHGLKNSAGQERLGIVILTGQDILGSRPSLGTFTSNIGQDETGEADKSWSRRVGRIRALQAVVAVPGGGVNSMTMLSNRATSLNIYPDHDPLVTAWSYTPGAPGGPGKIDFAPWPKLRLFAGQPDPADPSRFTIPYEIDGQPGEIRGRLRDDDTVELRPTTGSVTGDRWTPTAR